MAQLAARSDLRVTIDDTFDTDVTRNEGHFYWVVTVTIDNTRGAREARNVDVRVSAPPFVVLTSRGTPNPVSGRSPADAEGMHGLTGRLDAVTQSAPATLEFWLDATRIPGATEQIVPFRVRVSCNDQPDGSPPMAASAIGHCAGRQSPRRDRQLRLRPSA